MSVHEETAAELVRLEAAKADIAAYITEKGVEVPEGTALDGFRALLDAIVSGGNPTGFAKFNGGTTIFTSDTDSVEIEHGLGEEPDGFVVFRLGAKSKDEYYLNFAFYWPYSAYNQSTGGNLSGALILANSITARYASVNGVNYVPRNEVTDTVFRPYTSSYNFSFKANTCYYWLAWRV